MRIVAEADSEEDIDRIMEYVQQFQLDMVAMMYLQNAVAYDNKDLYLRAKEYLSRAEEVMQVKSVSFETKCW